MVFTFVLRPSKELLTKDPNYDVARAQSEILEKVPLTGMNELLVYVCTRAERKNVVSMTSFFTSLCMIYIPIVFNI